MRTVVLIVLFTIGCLVGAWSMPPSPTTNIGTRTIGYWKTHPQAWPTVNIYIGGIWYSPTQARSIMWVHDNRDMTYLMFSNLCAAILNIKMGNDSSEIMPYINQAQVWLYCYGLGNRVRANSYAWQIGDPYNVGHLSGEGIKDKLDEYNNGRMNVPHAN